MHPHTDKKFHRLRCTPHIAHNPWLELDPVRGPKPLCVLVVEADEEGEAVEEAEVVVAVVGEGLVDEMILKPLGGTEIGIRQVGVVGRVGMEWFLMLRMIEGVVRVGEDGRGRDRGLRPGDTETMIGKTVAVVGGLGRESMIEDGNTSKSIVPAWPNEM